LLAIESGFLLAKKRVIPIEKAQMQSMITGYNTPETFIMVKTFFLYLMIAYLLIVLVFKKQRTLFET
jgi:hypothetical protein